jgi:hypothetical protein
MNTLQPLFGLQPFRQLGLVHRSQTFSLLLIKVQKIVQLRNVESEFSLQALAKWPGERTEYSRWCHSSREIESAEYFLMSALKDLVHRTWPINESSVSVTKPVRPYRVCTDDIKPIFSRAFA